MPNKIHRDDNIHVLHGQYFNIFLCVEQNMFAASNLKKKKKKKKTKTKIYALITRTAIQQIWEEIRNRSHSYTHIGTHTHAHISIN